VIYFLDASVIVKRYVTERGSDAVRGLLRRRSDLAAARLSQVEVPAALARRARDGDIPAKAARKHADRVAADLARMHVVELRRRVVELAESLVWSHPLRAYDSVQLASALCLARDTGLAFAFWSADERLHQAALAEGLRARRIG
jgi:predicted nucleic acid-binding protein